MEKNNKKTNISSPKNSESFSFGADFNKDWLSVVCFLFIINIVSVAWAGYLFAQIRNGQFFGQGISNQPVQIVTTDTQNAKKIKAVNDFYVQRVLDTQKIENGQWVVGTDPFTGK